MTRVIEALAAPVVITTDFCSVVLTHRDWGHTLQPWNDPPLLSYNVLGVLRRDGSFAPYPGTEEYAPIAGADYATLLSATALGKTAGVFRNTDVQAAHQAIVARKGPNAPIGGA